MQPNTGLHINKRYINVLLLLIIVLYIINSLCYLRAQSITDDEGSFYSYAKRYLKGRPERIYPAADNSKMPFNVVNTLPRVAEQIMHPALKKSDNGDGDIMMGRYVTLFISVFTILLVFAWAGQLYGPVAGLFAAFLMSFCPNNLANASLVTSDSYSVLFLLLCIFLLWRFCRAPAIKNFILLSVAVAIAQLVKQSLFHLYIIVPLCLLIHFLINKKTLQVKKFAGYFLLFVAINWLIINAGYYFSGSFMALGNYHFMSNLFIGVQHSFPSWLPVPLPRPFVDGLDMAKYYDQLGGGYNQLSSFGKVTILGRSATGGAFWYYYFVSVLFKTPVSYFILLVWSIILLLKHTSFKLWINKEFFLAMPVVYFLVTLSFFYKTQCGIRHLIFIYPFLFIMCAGVVPYIKSRYSIVAATAACIFLIVSVLRYWRNYYPYTNEFIADKKVAYQYVGAGNLEFHQAFLFCDEYIKTHPGVSWVPAYPKAGTFLITMDDYLDIWNRHTYNWIARFKPSGIVAFSELLITVTPDDPGTGK